MGRECQGRPGERRRELVDEREPQVQSGCGVKGPARCADLRRVLKFGFLSPTLVLWSEQRHVQPSEILNLLSEAAGCISHC